MHSQDCVWLIAWWWVLALLGQDNAQSRLCVVDSLVVGPCSTWTGQCTVKTVCVVDSLVVGPGSTMTGQCTVKTCVWLIAWW